MMRRPMTRGRLRRRGLEATVLVVGRKKKRVCEPYRVAVWQRTQRTLYIDPDAMQNGTQRAAQTGDAEKGSRDGGGSNARPRFATCACFYHSHASLPAVPNSDSIWIDLSLRSRGSRGTKSYTRVSTYLRQRAEHIDPGSRRTCWNAHCQLCNQGAVQGPSV